jgi:hypothetical protein
MVEAADGIIEDPDTKDELVHVLFGIRDGVVYGLVCSHVFATGDPAEQIGGRGILLGAADGQKQHIDLSELIIRLQKPKVAAVIRGAFEGALFSHLVRATYENILLYCEKTRQFESFRAAPFYPYVRLVRNMLSHKDSGTLREWPKWLKGVTEVSWNGHTISVSQVGQEIRFTPAGIFELHYAMLEYVLREFV